MARHASLRPGFTLLEMILALSIGLVLMISVYSVLNLQVQQAQHGRLILHEGTLARSILARMSKDILSNIGPVVTQPAAATASAAAAGTAAATASGATTTTTSDTTISFNNGIYGTSNILILSVSKPPQWWVAQGLSSPLAADPTQQSAICDLRRISYWIVTDGDTPGLAVQELMQPTSNDLTTIPPDVTPGSYRILASEVKDILFEYFDGVNWQESWDGTTLGGPTLEIPVGPPSAIAITLTFNRPSVNGVDPPDVAKYRHVVAIPAGNNFPQTNQ